VELHQNEVSTVKILGWVLTGILGIVVMCLILVAVLPGYHIFVVKSESMEPSINMGDLVITGPVNGFLGNGIYPGTVISYQSGGKVVTHRVLAVDGNSIQTKGDAVEDPDPQSVDASKIVGVYLFKIPKVGYVSSLIHTKVGWFLLIILPSMLLVGWIAVEIIKEALKSPAYNTGFEFSPTAISISSRQLNFCPRETGSLVFSQTFVDVSKLKTSKREKTELQNAKLGTRETYNGLPSQEVIKAVRMHLKVILKEY
jgi:signal peptidase I